MKTLFCGVVPLIENGGFLMNVRTLVLGQVSTNCYICGSGNVGFVIDPADNAEKIYDEINKLKFNIKYIILTHAHFDHIKAAQELKNLTGAKIIVSTVDFDSLNKSAFNLADMFGVSVPHIEADILADDGDILEFDEFLLRFIMTPGHTLGSMCILVNNKVLFSGDTLFALSIGRTDFPGGSLENITASVKKLYLLDDDIKVYPGHNRTTSIGEEKKFNPYVNGAAK